MAAAADPENALRFSSGSLGSRMSSIRKSLQKAWRRNNSKNGAQLGRPHSSLVVAEPVEKRAEENLYAKGPGAVGKGHQFERKLQVEEAAVKEADVISFKDVSLMEEEAKNLPDKILPLASGGLRSRQLTLDEQERLEKEAPPRKKTWGKEEDELEGKGKNEDVAEVLREGPSFVTLTMVVPPVPAPRRNRYPPSERGERSPSPTSSSSPLENTADEKKEAFLEETAQESLPNPISVANLFYSDEVEEDEEDEEADKNILTTNSSELEWRHEEKKEDNEYLEKEGWQPSIEASRMKLRKPLPGSKIAGLKDQIELQVRRNERLFSKLHLFIFKLNFQLRQRGDKKVAGGVDTVADVEEVEGEEEEEENGEEWSLRALEEEIFRETRHNGTR